MKHDILFSLLIPQSEKLVIEDFVIKENAAKFLHPCECKILEDIIKIAKQYQDILKFTKTHGIHLRGNPSTSSDTEEPLQRGLYLQAFVSGVEKVLEDYIHEIVELEKRSLENPSNSLLFIFHKVDKFQPLFIFLQSLIDGIKVQKLHGCAIMQYLHQNMLNGNKKISDAMRIIFSSVNLIFIKQLTHWILYGKVLDTYGEFFIQSYEFRNNTVNSEKSNSATGSSGRQTTTTVSNTDATSTYAEVWRYEICHEFLPYYLSYSWAEKVLFIGQTVLMFKMGTNKTNKKNSDWHTDSSNYNENNSHSLWNDEEYKFFNMLQSLHNDGNDDCDNLVIISQYEKCIDDIKSYVTERLSQIAVKQADLIKQLKLIKDFYLLGRGELYLEFIKRTNKFDKITTETATTSGSPAVLNENIIRDLVRAFDSAANSVNITDDLESFSLSVSKNKIQQIFDIENFACFQYLCLQYKIEWPLHLLFSPKVIDRYNELFRFLLLVKKIQYELHIIWSLNRKQKSNSDEKKLMHLLHQLMFFIDNLQYYIQVDVLESQFSILMNTIHNSPNFENIQRAHSIFHANILSLCFLLSNDELNDNTQTSIIQQQTYSENPVLSIINKIFHLCEKFCIFAKSCESPLTKDDIIKNDSLEEQFLKLIKELMNLLVSLKAAPNSTPLSQLLLRLDFNYWFSRDEN